MTKHLYLMRHGQTLFNQRRKIQGWCDSPLTETGIEQAKAAKKLLEGIQFDHYYCSTAERCCDTLELVIGQDQPYKRMKQLKERYFGIFEGESEDLNPRYTKEFTFDDMFPYYGGETTAQVSKRMNDCLTEIMEKDDHHTVLAVSHAGATFSFFATMMDAESIRENGGFGNCNIAHFEFNDGKFKLIEILRPEI